MRIMFCRLETEQISNYSTETCTVDYEEDFMGIGLLLHIFLNIVHNQYIYVHNI